ncbi:hypothetical protein [Ramlibacter lithotrophicus]|uniref:hypothetical protein n=1 Tax=Ramlibacter lithotrophicus TaxID=2606681 RepID=UPI00143980E3|nr:hypothetical protein [Ramlibacter lithotrophicus]
MTTPDKKDSVEPPHDEDGRRSPGTGRGADSALTALIKRRVPPPEPPPSTDAIDDQA